MRTPLSIIAASLILLSQLTGCATSTHAKVTLRGQDSKAILAQTFNQAYISASHDGEYDVVLVQDAATQKAGFFQTNPKPLQPVSADQLRQVVHLHVFWQAQGGSVARDGVVTNSTVDWYVLGNPGSDQPQILRYQGAGYVLINEGNRTASVLIRDGSLKMSDSRGGLTDPIGPSRLTGTIKALRNSAYVKNVIADLRSQSATATAVTSAR